MNRTYGVAFSRASDFVHLGMPSPTIYFFGVKKRYQDLTAFVARPSQSHKSSSSPAPIRLINKNQRTHRVPNVEKSRKHVELLVHSFLVVSGLFNHVRQNRFGTTHNAQRQQQCKLKWTSLSFHNAQRRTIKLYVSL